MAGLDHLGFLFVTGKGGVGKTTVTVAIARAMAARGRRVLVVASDKKERVSLLMGAPALGPSLASLGPGIWGVQPDPHLALREYGEMILKSRTLTAAVFDSKYTRGFFAGVPGLSEWAVLGKAWFHATERRPDGEPRFHTVLFDAPATGHGLDMLRVPKIIVDLVPPGVLRRDAERAWELFQDPQKSGVVVVTLAEDMPANETVELTDALAGELGLPLALLVVNGVMTELFTPAERAALLAPRELDRHDPGDAAVSAGVRRAIRERVQAEAMERLAGVRAASRVLLPRLYRDATREDALVELQRAF